MKKVIYSLFILCLLFSYSIVKTTASSNNYYYTKLTSNEQVYYEALEKMYNKNMFLKEETLDLFSEGYLTCEDVNDYVHGSNVIYSSFENAKKAFFLDHEEVFYVDIDKLQIRIYQSDSAQYFVEIGSGIYNSYLTNSYLKINEQINAYNEIVDKTYRKAKKLETLEEKIDYVINDLTLTSPQLVKSVLDELHIDNILVPTIGSLISVESEVDSCEEVLCNFYHDGNTYVELNSKISLTSIALDNFKVSNVNNSYNNIGYNEVSLLENSTIGNYTITSLELNKIVENDPLIMASNFYQINIYEDQQIINETLKTPLTILLPYPKGYAKNSSQVDFVVRQYDEETAAYVEIESVCTNIGLVVDINRSTELKVEVVEEKEKEAVKEIVVLLNIGGTSTIEGIQKIKIDKNIKFDVVALEDYIVEKISIDGNYIKFKPSEEFQCAINYNEVEDGSIVIIEFLPTNKYVENNTWIKRESQDVLLAISGSNYAFQGGKASLSVEGEFKGSAVYEWYHNGELVARTDNNKYTIDVMTENDRGNYQAKVIITNGIRQSIVETDSFKLHDTVIMDEDPFVYTILLCGIILIGFVIFVICDNASFNQVNRRKR
ncbi:MAG: hypothetical protein IKC22_03245 [Bacilli bacterium]|nr:hypothetical protein [Bacilli bacterium]